MTLVIQTPEKLSAEAKEALRKFDALTGNTLNQDIDSEKTDKKKRERKNGFMDKLKESFED